ncbi:MAG: HIT family protein [Verrucomicrobia bacterium]|nr:HIT family protein [Verrucomicrobiota bacterium]MDE3047410.1 HIT family protein [Verrucomicrobiota bacterium]
MIHLKKLILPCVTIAGVAAATQLDFQRFMAQKQSGCAFCTANILERQTFYRGDKSLAILTHKPAVEGHVLIIPKRHVERFEELTPEEVAEMGETIKKVDAVVRRAFGTKGSVIVQKNGREAGQTVPHVHFHYLPASRGLALNFFLSPWLKPKDSEQLMRLRETLSAEFSKYDAIHASPPVNSSLQPESGRGRA